MKVWKHTFVVDRLQGNGDILCRILSVVLPAINITANEYLGLVHIWTKEKKLSEETIRMACDIAHCTYRTKAGKEKEKIPKI
jgi:hypothetical protein